MAACYHPEIVPGAMRHGQARSWLRARAGSRAASARTRASQWPGPTAARGAPVRIDLGEQNRRASERAAAKMGDRSVDMYRRADRYRSILVATVKGYRTVKILWPTDDCSKSSRLYKREYMAISATFGVIC